MKFLLEKEEGLTLLEVLISIVILSIIGLSVLSAMGFSMNSAFNLSQESVALNLARQRIEAIKQFEGLSLSDAAFDNRLAGFIVPVRVNDTDYQVFSNRIINNPNIPSGVYPVQTTVQWVQKGVNRRLSFTTYYLR